MNRKYEFKIHIWSYLDFIWGKKCFYFWFAFYFLPDDEKALA